MRTENRTGSASVLERWTRPDIGHLHVEMVVTDPKFTRAYSLSTHVAVGQTGDEVHEYSCAETTLMPPHLGPGPGPIGPDGQRGYETVAPLPPPPTKDHPAVTSIPD